MPLSHLIYRAAYSQAQNIELLISKDIDEAGELWGVQIVKAIQYFMQTLPPQTPIVIHFCTGDTPWIGYRKLVDWMQTWKEPATQAIVQKHSLLNLKPDMQRVVAFPLDALFPQQRSAYHSFATLLTALFDHLGIPDANRHLLYGDLIWDESGQVRQMTAKEFATLMQDVATQGLLWPEYQNNQLQDGLQYRHLKAMEYHSHKLSLTAEELGGGHIFLYGVGPSDEGQGHVAFIEAGTSFDRKIFLDTAGYFVAAGHAKENSGLGAMYAKNHRVMYGFVTFGFHELLYRQRQGQEEFVIGLATSNNKAESVRHLIEGKSEPAYPLTALQQSLGSLVLDNGSSYRLRLMLCPWEFKTIETWSSALIRKFFLQLSDATGKTIHNLNPEDFRKLPLRGSGEITTLLAQIRQANLVSLTGKKAWQELRDEVSRDVAGKLAFPNQVAGRVGLVAPSKVVIINPHMDDEFLAMDKLIRELTAAGHRVVTYYLAKGFTAVHDSYIFAILDRIRQINDEELRNLPSYEAIVTKLCELCLARQNPHAAASDLNPWRHMSELEQTLRVQTLAVQIIQYFRQEKGAIVDSTRKLKAIADFLQQATLAKSCWGGVDIDLMSQVKTWLRITEATSAMMGLGLKFCDIHPPVEISWYSASGRSLTASSNDIEKLRKIIADEQPDLLVSNGEGFPDYGAHSTTEISTYLALWQLMRNGAFAKKTLPYLQYAGVWDRITADDAALCVVLTDQDLGYFSRIFRNFYPSQAPAPVPDPGTKEINFFSDRVCDNAIVTRKEIVRLLGNRIPKEFAKLLLDRGSGVLAYKWVHPETQDFAALVEQKQIEMEQVRKAKERSSNKSFQGDAPKVDAKKFAALLDQVGLPLV